MSSATIGAAAPRIDGPEKLTGRARYAADFQPEGMLHAYGVYSSIARGRLTQLELSSARNMPGVVDIFHHGHFPRLHRSPANFAEENMVDETRLPFEDNRIHYAGQFIALVVAETFEQARAAAYEVRAQYDAEKPIANLDQALAQQTPNSAGNNSRGDADAAFDTASHRIDAVYTTPVETHNPMELHATVAQWQDDRLVVHEATQGVVFARNTLAAVFDLDSSQVEVHAEFIGSGFGGKLWLWPHCIATCAAAREIGRPVQFMLPRQQMFTTVGHRPETRQHLRLAADDTGRLQSLAHDTINATSAINTFVENCGSASGSLYACDNVRVTHATVGSNRGTPTPMRAPGAGVGLFALESAMDELALELNMDPVELRRRNYTEHDGAADLPFSSIHLLETYDRAAERFGWSRRNPEIASMRDGDVVLGWGMASASWDAMRQPADAQVALRADGRVRVSCASQDIGTGTYTVLAQAAASVLGVELERIEVKLGDARLPHGPISGGSWATATLLPAVAEAARAAIQTLTGYAVAPGAAFEGVKKKQIEYANGVLCHGDRRVDFAEILSKQSLAAALGKAHTDGAPQGKYAFRSFGAHFVEIGWQPETAQLTVRRVVSAIDVGRIMNAHTARNQAEGGIMMGLGSALFEATHYDERDALPVNSNYAEYLVPVHADMPELDVILLDHPDYELNEFGARGIGEIGVTGVQAAVANAVYHATGVRIRDLPITLDKLIAETH